MERGRVRRRERRARVIAMLIAGALLVVAGVAVIIEGRRHR